jgi:hypothetical protein
MRRHVLLIVAGIALLCIPLAWAQVYDNTTGQQKVITTASGTGTNAINLSQVGGGAVPSLGTGIAGFAIAPTATAAAGITPVVSASLEASHVLDASPGNLYSVYASNLTGGTTGILQVFNATSAPVDGAVTPIVCVPFDASGKAQAVYAPGPPAVFATGITAVISSATSCFTKTTGVLTGFISGLVK